MTCWPGRGELGFWWNLGLASGTKRLSLPPCALFGSKRTSGDACAGRSCGAALRNLSAATPATWAILILHCTIGEVNGGLRPYGFRSHFIVRAWEKSKC